MLKFLRHSPLKASYIGAIRYNSTVNDLSDFRTSLQRWIQKEIQPNIGQWERDGLIPRKIYKQAANLGVFASGYPVEYGGLGNSPYDLTYPKVITEELCAVGSGGLIASLCTHSISLPPILHHGNDILKKEIITSVLSGDKVCSLCVTEPSGGSDVANIQTTATLQSNGTYLLNGIKTFITSGVQADYYTVAARTAVPSPSSSSSSSSSQDRTNQPYYGISLFAISSTLPGITKTSLDKMGWLCSDTATIYFDNVTLPAHSLIGELHHGFPLLMKNFNSERILLSLQSYYFSRNIYNSIVEYSKHRHVFKKPLLSNQVIQHQFIDCFSQLYCNELLLKDVFALYWEYSQEKDMKLQRMKLHELSMKSAIVKNYSTDLFHEIANRGVQIMGGAGYMREERNMIERLYRETKVMQIGGGSTEIMKELIGKYLGFHRSN